MAWHRCFTCNGNSFLTDSILIQVIVFVITSILLLIFTRPLVNKFVKVPKEVKTNAYSIIGKKGIVISAINNIEGSGQIKIDGEVWSAKSANDDDIAKDTEVEIIEIDGVKAVVTTNLQAKVPEEIFEEHK